MSANNTIISTCINPLKLTCCATSNVVNCYNSKGGKTVEFQNLLAVLWKYRRFTDNVISVREQARDYYNNKKNYCKTFNMTDVSGGEGRLSLYLNYPGCNSPEYNNVDFNHNTFLLRVVGLLPKSWSSNNNTALQNNELILKAFINNIKFLTDIKLAFNFSKSFHTERKHYCKTFTVPGFLSNDGNSYKITLNGDEIRMIQCLLLRGQLMSSFNKIPYNV